MRLAITATLLLFLQGIGFCQPPVTGPPSIGGCPVLPAENIWNTTIDSLPVSPKSSTWIESIGASAGAHPDFGSGTWEGKTIGLSYVTVSGTQRKFEARFVYQSESDRGPYAIPLDAPIEGGAKAGGDRHVISIDTDNCILYELYGARPQIPFWKAGSGAIFDLRSNALRPVRWTSADEGGLPIFPGLVRWAEVANGEIRHALRFTVPQTERAHVWPARHYGPSASDSKYPPLGARFRLRAGFDISKYSTTNKVILRALKTYGVILADEGLPWYISGEPNPHWDNSDLHKLDDIKGIDWEAVDVTPLMVNPDSGEARQSPQTGNGPGDQKTRLVGTPK